MKLLIVTLLLAAVVLIPVFLITSCAARAPLPTPARVDLEGFMGTWYVLGFTPLGVDSGAHNAIEHYHLAEDGRIETTYQFRKGGVDGELKTLRPVGEVYDTETNAEWRMQFIWPFKADYVILHLSEEEGETIVAHPNRKYAWIMARHPEISEARYDSLVARLAAEGFDPEVLVRLPHDWSKEIERKAMIDKAGSRGKLEVD